ncbi:MAG: pyruvate dehydrogenase E1 component beta subunit [Chloroflexi bacterium]|jgi:pyruvate dehydrogenase E1 component beta subunit|nr:MAG: pyruvate dehydrogenase E1 component beta subunit [Chloroflexota bacterium]
MPEITIRDAISQGLKEALDNDERVFIMGEDVGYYGGAYAVTKGFVQEYGERRIMDTPISESVFVGAGVGAAMAGLRPVVEIMTINFSLLAMDQIVNHAAKIHYMSGGQLKAPVIIRTVTGGGAGLAATHSQSLEGWYATVPGLKVITPATPYDALGLLRTAFKDENPIIYAEHDLLYRTRGEVPEEYYEVPFGQARIAREGTDITIVANSGMVRVAEDAAKKLEARGVSAEVIDLRTLRPLDIDTIAKSVHKTNRCIVVEETWRFGGFGSFIASEIQEIAFDDLDAPVARVGCADVPAPYSKPLEDLQIPNGDTIIREIERVIGL